jgi:hypothetical protein
MNPKAVEQAENHFLAAEKAVGELKSAKSFVEAKNAWSAFLAASSTIYAKLEQGKKGFPKSEPWFGRIKHVRLSDPLLRYILVARNVDTHGLESVTSEFKDNSFLKFNEVLPIKVVVPPDNGEAEGRELDAVIAGPTIKLAKVVCKKYGAADPPDSHLGNPVPYGRDFPYQVAVVALAYLRSMIDEAAKL